MGGVEPITVPVHYDFASSLCYVAHRVLGRMADFLDEAGLELCWSPIDLSRLMGWRPGAKIHAHRLDDIRQIAEGLDVPMHVPTRWQDSRRVACAALAIARRDEEHGSRLEPAWRERLFTAVYEQGGRCDEDGLVEKISAQMSIALSDDELDQAADQLDTLTVEAAAEMVTGVPTFMLGEFPFGGIQDELTMRSILGRFAEKRRTAC